MIAVEKNLGAEIVLSVLPKKLRDEVGRIVFARRGGIGEMRELRVRAGGRSSLICKGEVIRLCTVVTREEMDALVNTLCDGALYAHKDSIASGYLSMPHGVRVGICGYARYEHKNLVGVSDMRSLVFRVPSGECEFEDELYEIFKSGIGAGLLIYSPPGVGKTTALRSLARKISGGSNALRVAVVDERCEFDEGDYESCEIDILKGYKRRAGIEIATRTMSPDIIMIDEIGGEDAQSILDVVRCGIPLVATAHAASFEELSRKANLKGLFELCAFNTFVGISKREDAYLLTVDRNDSLS